MPTYLAPLGRPWSLVWLIVGGGGVVASGLVAPWVIQGIVDGLVTGASLEALGLSLGALGGLAVVTGGLVFGLRRALRRAQQAAALDRLCALEDDAGERDGRPRRGPALRRRHQALVVLYGEVIPGWLALPALPLLTLALLSYDGTLGMVGLALAGVNGLGYALGQGRRRWEGTALARVLARFAAAVAADLQPQRWTAIKAEGGEARVLARWRRHYRRQDRRALALALSGQRLATWPRLVGGLAQAVLLTAGGYRIMAGALSAGELMACQTLLFALNDALQRGFEAQRLYPLLRAELAEGEPPSPEGRAAVGGAVARGRPGSQAEIPPVVPGRPLAVLPDPEALESLRRTARAQSWAWVDGGAPLLPDTLRENVRLWHPALDDAAVAGALQRAGYGEALTLPRGLETPLGDTGRPLSGGQRQRVLIARGRVGRPPGVVLAFALESLDLPLAKSVLQALGEDGIAAVVVSQRAELLDLCVGRWTRG